MWFEKFYEETTAKEREVATVTIPKDDAGFVIGRKYQNIDRIRTQNNVDICVRGKKNKHAIITINGKTQNVKNAENDILNLVKKSQTSKGNKQPYPYPQNNARKQH